MSEKTRDPRGRWRNVSVCFRLSQEENALLNKLVQLSGLSKREYLANRAMRKDIVVHGNPRVYKALRSQMEQIHSELFRLSNTSEITDEFLELFQVVTNICADMKNS